MKKVIFFLLLVGLSFSLLAQTNKGMKVISTESTSTTTTGKTYALIVGISKYKDPAIPQLQFADRDAIAFRNYLVASGVDSNNISLFTNEHARYGEIMLNLDELCANKVKAGDRLFIYFSGHGDVESRTIAKTGYLLPYDAPPIVYSISAIKVTDLQDYLSTASAKGVQVILFTDACHSGKLAGGMDGMTYTANLLGEKWRDEIKILSCQPGEVSLENNSWGGGRGLFSYELVNGMTGLADKNQNGKISLYELYSYLSQKVHDEALPIAQNPMWTGNPEYTISSVNKDYMSHLNSNSSKQSYAAVDTKGLDDVLLKNLNDSIKENYRLFKEYLVSEVYVSYYNKRSAYYYYNLIPENESTKLLLSLMKRNLSAAFINTISIEIEDMVRKKEIVYKRPGFAIHHLQDDNNIAAALRTLLEESHLKELGILPKIIYIEVLQKYIGHVSLGLKEEEVRQLLFAAELDPNASYIYQLMAFSYDMQGKYDSSAFYARRAINISPHYAQPYWYLANSLMRTGQNDSAQIILNKLLLIDSSYSYAVCRGTAENHYLKGEKDSAEYYFNKLYGFKTNDPSDSDFIVVTHRSIANAYHNLKDYKDAISYYLKIADLNLKGDWVTLFNIACCYSLLDDKQNGLKYLEASLKKGNKDSHVQTDVDLNNIRSEPEFKKLMNKYFPEKEK